MADYELNSVLNPLESIELNSTLDELQPINANFVIDYRPDKTSQLINDSGFIDISALDNYATKSFVTSQGYITNADLSGYATKNFVTSQGYITNTALNGYATETWVGNQGYITGINSSDVTNALGYTPYDSSNPNGYTSNVGTVTSVNNIQPVNGNVTISIPSEVTETTVANWGFTKNLGTVTSVNNVSPTNGNVSITIPTDTSDLTNGAGYITSSALSGYLTTADIVSSVSSSSTNSKAVGAKLFYDTCGDIETAINTIRGV